MSQNALLEKWRPSARIQAVQWQRIKPNSDSDAILGIAPRSDHLRTFSNIMMTPDVMPFNFPNMFLMGQSQKKSSDVLV